MSSRLAIRGSTSASTRRLANRDDTPAGLAGGRHACGGGCLRRRCRSREGSGFSRSWDRLEPPLAAERMKMRIISKDFRVREGDEVNLKKWPTKVNPVYRVEGAIQKFLEEHVTQLSSQQQLLYASNHYAVLLIFQAMDTAGKDGAIKHVMSGVNPQGCQVFSYRKTQRGRTRARLLWRTTRDLPGRGKIGIFDGFPLRGGADCSRTPRDSSIAKEPEATTTRRWSGSAAIARLRIWRDTSTGTAPASSSSFSTSPKKNSESASSRGWTKRQELEIQYSRHCREEISGTST